MYMKKVKPIMGRLLLVFIGVLLLSAVPLPACAQQTSTGMEDIDTIRKEVLVTATDTANCDSRRTALIRWWRFLWRQGYDLSSFDEVAQKLLYTEHDSAGSWRAMEEGFSILESVTETLVRIKEVSGTLSTAVSSTTDWPFYMGPSKTNRGTSPDVGPSEGKLAWRFPKGYAWDATPVIEDGKIYLSSPGIDVVAFCLDEKSGKALWRARQYGESYYGTPTTKHSPWVTDQHVIIRTDASDAKTSNLHIFDKKTGERVVSSASDRKACGNVVVYKQRGHAMVWADAQSGDEIWRYETSEYLTADPAISGETVYLATKQGTVHAFDVNEKLPRWTVKLNVPLRGEVTIGEKLLYIGSKDGGLCALDRKTGEKVWSKKSPDPESRSYQYYSKVLESKNRIYVGGASGFLYCLNQSDGKLIWKHRLTDWVRSRPFLKGKTLYVATLDGMLTALSDQGDTAELLWSKKLAPHGFTADLVGGSHSLLACGRDYIMYAVDFETGDVLWKHGILDGAWVDGKFYYADWSGGLLGSPTVVDGVVYIGGPDGFVNAVDVESGKEIWKFETPGTISISTTVVDGKVLFSHLGGFSEHHGFEAEAAYYAIDQKTGQEVWQTSELGKVWVSGAYHDGVMCIGNMNGTVYGINPDTGEKLWSYFTAKDTPQENRPLTGFHHGWPPGVYSVPLCDDEYFYTGSWSGYYFAFEQKTGKLAWRCQTGNPASGGGLPDSAAPMLWEDHVYVQKRGARVAAINTRTGMIDWEWKPKEPHLQNGTIAAANNLIFGSTVNQVTALPYTSKQYAFTDVEGGSKLKWKINGGCGLTAPVLAGGRLIYGSSTGMFMTCVDPETGALKWRLFTGGEMLENVPAIYGNKVFNISKNGWLNAIE
jgi:outer membrane protein assembly factor BamB